MLTMSGDLYACWDQNGSTRGDPLYVPIGAAEPDIPFVSEIIRGRARKSMHTAVPVVPAWVCHGELPSSGNAPFYGL